MAFPVPDHLPRSTSKQQPEVSTAILTALAEETPVTLASTSKWVKELEQAIAETKVAIRERIQKDSDAFDRQLDTSRSVQRRLVILTSNVDGLQNELEDSESGVLPNIIRTLRNHSDLAQRACDADVTNTFLLHLSKCKGAYQELFGLLKEGRLPEAVVVNNRLQDMVNSCPPALGRSAVMNDLQGIVRSSKDRIQEQLQKSLAECVSLTDSHFNLRNQHSTHLTLHDIFVSLPPEVLVSDLTALRKDIFTRYIDRILQGHISLALHSSALEVQRPAATSYFPALSNLFVFLHQQLLPYLPVPHRGDFAASFYIPLAEAIQSRVLVTLIPSTTADLATYLALVRDAIDFETKLVNMGFFLGVEHRIRAWGDGVQSHYEKKRRAELLDKARVIILTDIQPPLHIEVDAPLSALPDTSEEEVSKVETDEANWDFDDDEKSKTNGHTEKEKEEEESAEDGWGFDDDDDLPKEEEPKEENHDPWGMEWDDPPALSEDQPAANKATKTPTSAKPRESYLVSHAAMEVAALAREILDEGLALMRSSVFQDLGFPTIHSALLLSTTPSAFDLFLALYPISRVSAPHQKPSDKLRYSNDCKYLSGAARELQGICEAQHYTKAREPSSLKTHFEETAERLTTIGSSWLEDTIDEEIQSLLKELDEAGRFTDLTYDASFTVAQDKIKRVKNRITLLTQELKVSLTASASYTALGTIIDAGLDQMLQNVLSMRDISEVQSERIATLFRIMHPLDTLFPELENGVSTVASYVTLWLKFLYLSDIMEGTMADITSWFDAGYLIDYEPEELAQLITALFDESPLRSNTIYHIRAAHPA